MLRENKNAIIYGAGGAIGGAVARTMAPKKRTHHNFYNIYYVN